MGAPGQKQRVSGMPVDLGTVVEAGPADRKWLLSQLPKIRTNPYSEPDGFVADVRANLGIERTDLAEAVSAFRQDQESVALWIHALPTGRLSGIETPLIRDPSPPKSDFQSEAVIVGVATLLGEPFSFALQNYGHLVQNIFPIQSDAELQIGSNSAELTLHVDGAFRESAPDYILLLCLRAPVHEDIETFLAPMRDALGVLTASERALLDEPRFCLGQALSYGGENAATVAIHSTRGKRDIFRFETTLLRGADLEAQAVVDKLREYLVQHKSAICLQEGDLLAFRNLTCVHGRSSFKPRYDGTDRWLQRVFVMDDIASAQDYVGHQRVSGEKAHFGSQRGRE